jgi:hypothetical protein
MQKNAAVAAAGGAQTAKDTGTGQPLQPNSWELQWKVGSC